MADEIFVDTGAWLALADRDDGLHLSAHQTFSTLLRSGNRFVTTNLVVAEAYALVRRRVGHDAAMRLLRETNASPRLERIYSNLDIELSATVILAQYADQDFTFVDAVSFVVMRERGITQAFAFDHHFRVGGFLMVP